MADAPAVVLSWQRQENVPLPPDDVEALTIEVSYAPPLEVDRRYNLRVHVDVSGIGTVTPGDFITVQANPVQPEAKVLSVGVHEV